MVVAQRITEAEYREFALGADGAWELWNGELREKPIMSMMHHDVANQLGHTVQFQLDPRTYRVQTNSAKLRISSDQYFIPDVAVVPTSLLLPYRSDPRSLNAYAEPLPLVVEVRSPSTQLYDQTVKLAGYRARGDAVIWYLHPFKRTLTVWRRLPDGSYGEEEHEGGVVAVASLPGVAIDLDVLFIG